MAKDYGGFHTPKAPSGMNYPGSGPKAGTAIPSKGSVKPAPMSPNCMSSTSGKK